MPPTIRGYSCSWLRIRKKASVLARGRDRKSCASPSAWGRGYATEAGRAVVAIARHALGLKRLNAGHFIDNPASGRVLTKLGFRATGRVEPRHSRARGGEAPCAVFELDLDEGRMCDVKMAA